jgi:serine/threonine-protein kinase
MDREHWQQIRQVHAGALERPVSERVRFLDEECAGDDELRHEVEALLAHAVEDTVLERPPVDPPKPNSAEPILFGRYAVKKTLGAGAMGVVYLAEDPVIAREVAIKVMKTLPGQESAGLQKRFEGEFRSAGALSHPSVVAVHDVGQEGHQTFIAMEFVSGQGLDQLLSSKKVLPDEQAADLLTQICSALDYAHERGIVHRDIKPANIIVSSDGRAKVTDFGIAKVVDRTGTGVTESGVAIGTPAYMSPEQSRGLPITGAADQFAVGVIAYQMLTGERPFTGDSLSTVMYKIVHEEPIAPAAINPMVSKTASDAVMRALAKNPSERFPTCGELVGQIRSGFGLPAVSSAGSGKEEPHTELLSAVSATPAPSPVPSVSFASSGKEEPHTEPLSAVSATPAPSPVPSSEVETRLSGGTTMQLKWVIPAGVAAALVAVVTIGTLIGRSSPPPEAAPRVAVAPAFSRVVQIRSAVPGAQIFLDGSYLGLDTPAAVELQGDVGQRVRLELRREGQVAAATSLVLGDGVLEEWAPVEAGVVAEPEIFTVSTDPAGARVRLNGEQLDGVTPLDVELRPEQEYEMRVMLDGYDGAGLTFALDDLAAAQRDGTALHFPLQASVTPGRLLVTAPYPIELTVQPTGGGGARTFRAATNQNVSLRPGGYDIQLSAPDVFFAQSEIVEIGEGQQLTLPVPKAVSVNVAAVPSNCRVSIDGRYVDVTPLGLTIVTGRHQFKFEWPALGESLTRSESISRDQQRIFASAQ